MYTSIIRGERSASDPEKQFITDQQTALDQFESDSDSVENCFVTGGVDTDISGATFDENTWTRRLCGCLKLVVTDELKHSIRYTAEDGPWFGHKQSKETGLPVDLVGCYPFRGAPDVTIKRRVISQLKQDQGI